MKRLVLLLFVLLVANTFASAQIIANFEVDANGFGVNGWGSHNSMTVSRVADPTGVSAGVLQLHMNWQFRDKEASGIDNVDVKGAPALTYWVYLPANIPDSVQIGVYAQNMGGSWVWNEKITNSQDIPKGVWYPLTFDLAGTTAKNANFDVSTYKLKTGLQINNFNAAAADTIWSGDILVDNVSLVGVEPIVIQKFDAGIGNLTSLWGTAPTFSTVDDPKGKYGKVAQLSSVVGGGAVGFSNTLDGSKGNLLVFWVYLPADAPDALLVKTFAQDNANWAWNENDYHGVDIPKETWFPLYFDMAAVRAKPGSNFDHIANKIGKAGFEIDNVGSMTGNVLIASPSFLGLATGQKWVVADFEAVAGGLYGFGAAWGSATGTLAAMADPTGINTTRVLNVPAIFTSSGDGKLAISKGNINIKSTVDKTVATAIAMDIYLPADFPDGGQIGVFFFGSVLTTQTGGWTEDLFHTYGPDSLVKGKWNTVFYNVAHHDSLGDLIDSLAGTVGVQIYFSTSPTWSGNLYFDNLTLVGIPTPTGTLVSPVTTAMTDTTLVKNGNIVHFVRFDWVDNALGSESYNLYVSKSAIGGLTDPGVVKFASNVVHGLQKYAHRPYTSTGATENLYYAITATDGVTETPLRPECKVGPISIQSTPTFKVKYDANFKNNFVLDGDFSEFAPYTANEIVPESAGGDSSYDWTPASTKLNFKLDMVIDDKYLYIAADITDNTLNIDPTCQAWSGDAIEFYLGAYDIRPLTEWHGKNFQNSNGDWRIGFLANGGLASNGGATGAVIPGTSTSDFVILGKLTGDGYQVEARLNLDSLAAAPHTVAVTNGMLIPFRIDCNSSQPSAIGTRILQIGVGGTPTGGRVDQDQDWTRPQGWGQLEVINGPAAVTNTDNGLPKEFKLYLNYPNPFNPSTIIRYDLKQDVPVSLKVYNVLGQEVMTLVNERQKAGRYSVNFDARGLASGMYIYSIHAGTFIHSEKMMLLK